MLGQSSHGRALTQGSGSPQVVHTIQLKIVYDLSAPERLQVVLDRHRAFDTCEGCHANSS